MNSFMHMSYGIKKRREKERRRKSTQTLLLCIGYFIGVNKLIKPSNIGREKDCKVFIIIVSYTYKSSHCLSIFLLHTEFLKTR